MKPSLLTTKLTTWKRTKEDEEFVEKAIDSLYKKLKSKSGAIEEFERVLAYPDPCSKCITIPRSLDGRLQILHRKGLPHVIYCRIYRWPDLQSQHELRPIANCSYSFTFKRSEICINPYHYERAEMSTPLPQSYPRLQSNYLEYSPDHSVMPYQHNHESTHHNKSSEYDQLYNRFNTEFREKENEMTSHIDPSHQQHQSYSNCATLNNGVLINNYKTNINYNYYYYYNQTLDSVPEKSVTYPNNQQMGDDNSYNECNMSQSSPLASSSSSSTSSLANRQSHSEENASLLLSSVMNQMPECSNWFSIVYYELNTRVGEIFHSNSSSVIVDGFTEPCLSKGKRMCLGMFSNVNRNHVIENCRRHIGKGVHVYIDNGDVYVENLSSSPVFIQSKNCNRERGFHESTVCKLPSSYSLRIFQSKLFAQLLRESITRGFDSVYELSHMCVVTLSFVKGWGAEYYRQDVSTCPCWIEIRLNMPFQWLDQVLKEMGSSSNPATSVS